MKYLASNKVSGYDNIPVKTLKKKLTLLSIVIIKLINLLYYKSKLVSTIKKFK